MQEGANNHGFLERSKRLTEDLCFEVSVFSLQLFDANGRMAKSSELFHRMLRIF